MANWRYHMVVTDAGKSGALGFMAGIGASGGFNAPLSADGSAPATHWGQSIQLTESQRAAIDAATAGETLPAGLSWWRDDAARLVSQQLFRDSNFPGTGATVGQPWTYGNCLGDVGVQAVV